MTNRELIDELRRLALLTHAAAPEASNTLRLAAERLSNLHRERLTLDKRLVSQRAEIASLEASREGYVNGVKKLGPFQYLVKP